MDRELQVLQEGYVFASADFNYTSQTGGNADVTVNEIIDVAAGLKSVIPLLKYKVPFEHEIFTSIDEIKAFDKLFINKQPIANIPPDETLDYTYPPMGYRYVINGAPVIGIANIASEFAENKKDLHFISARRIKWDGSLMSDSLEANITLIKRMAETLARGFDYTGAERVY